MKILNVKFGFLTPSHTIHTFTFGKIFFSLAHSFIRRKHFAEHNIMLEHI